MNFYRKEFNRNKIIIPAVVIIIFSAAYAMAELSKTMKPMTLEEYEARYSVPEFPKPIR